MARSPFPSSSSPRPSAPTHHPGSGPGAPDPPDAQDPWGDRHEGPDDLLDRLRPPPLHSPWERLAEWRVGRGRSSGQLVASALALVALAAVGWWLLRPPAPPVESSIPLAATGATTEGPGGASGGGAATGAGPGDGVAGEDGDGASAGATTSTVADVVVQAAGAVGRPGVYRLPPDARVDDLVRRAGGLRADADADRVNLAAPLVDGERIWVPRQGEADPPEVVAGAGGGSGSGRSAGGGGPGGSGIGASATPAVVDLNTATADDLDTLPGIGPATASAILAYRDEHGRFSTVDELLEVRGIGDAKLEQLRPLVRV